MSAAAPASLHDDVATLLASLSISSERVAFLDHAVRGFLGAARSLSAEEKERRVVELLALASRLLSDRPGSSELAARQLCELCAILVGELKGGRDLFHVGPEPATFGRARAPSRAPTLDAETPRGALKLSSIVATMPALGAPPRELRGALASRTETDPPVGRAKGAAARATSVRDARTIRPWMRGSAEVPGRAK